MRLRFDKARAAPVKKKHRLSLDEAPEIFDRAYLMDIRIDDPEQFRAIGWCCGRPCSVIFEVRHDAEGEYYHLIAAWKATYEEERCYAENI